MFFRRKTVDDALRDLNKLITELTEISEQKDADRSRLSHEKAILDQKIEDAAMEAQRADRISEKLKALVE